MSSRKLSDLEIMGSSGLGASMAVVITNPLEVAKTRIQQQNELVRAKTKVYRHGLDCLLQTYRKEGIRGVQRGLEISIIRDGSKCFFRLGLYEPILRRIHPASGDVNLGAKGAMAPFHKQLFAGAASGLVAAVVCNPLDLCKVRIQTSGSLATVHHDISHLTTWQVAKKVFHEEGLAGFWKGVQVNILRSISFTSILMSVNSRVKHSLAAVGFQDGPARDICGSLIGSFIGIFAMNPVDVLRTRLYNQPIEKKLYNGMLDATMKIARTEGVFAFWKGMGSHYARVGPHTVLTFVFIGKIKRLILDRKELTRTKYAQK